MPNLVDTHCHIDFHQYDQDREIVLERAWRAGLTRILVPGIDIKTSQDAVDFSESYDQIYAAVGLHPNSSDLWDSWIMNSLEIMSQREKVVAIGEIGLDYYRHKAPRKHQIHVFKQQLKLAQEKLLPVVIHTRNASFDDHSCIIDLIKILSGRNCKMKYPGVVHSYSGNLTEADELINMGFFIGITGPITYKNAIELREVVEAVPLENLLIETDGPFLAPQQKRGKRNEPAYVRFVAEKISEVRNQPFEEVVAQVQRNAELLFGWVKRN